MPCVLALIVLSILGLFSASHRKLAKEAFDCVFRRVTLRPCNTGFDTKVKVAILGRLINRSPALTKFVSQRFELLSWILIITMTASFGWTARGLYNFWAWGDCNGPNSGGFCAFDPTGANNKVSSMDEGNCVDAKLAIKNLSLKPLNLADYPSMGTEQNQIVFLGCYDCDYTRKAWPMMQVLLKKIPATFTFIHFPTKPETKYLMAYDYCVYQENPDVFWQYVERMFSNTKEQNADEAQIQTMLESLGLKREAVSACVQALETKQIVEKRFNQIQTTGIYGTPTVFVNGTPVVGPKPERVYRRLLKGGLF